MSDKPLTDLKKFIESVNKKSGKHNGKVTRFAWLKRKRKH